MDKFIEKLEEYKIFNYFYKKDIYTKVYSNIDKNYYIEINPRFGGGAPLSIKAGADSAEAMIRLLNGEQLCYQDKKAEDGAIFSRFDQSVRVK